MSNLETQDVHDEDVKQALYHFTNLHKSWTTDCDDSENAAFNFTLPYYEITKLVYDFKDKENLVGSGQITAFGEKISLELDDKKFSLRAQKAHEKFLDHILLAKVQKNFILKYANQADRIAKDADDIAKHAGSVAKKAEKQAVKAKKMSSSMMTNYVTILGVFATIIVTVFGGLNTVSSALKMLEKSAHIYYLGCVISFLMACLTLLICLLIHWIERLNLFRFDSSGNIEKAYENSCRYYWIPGIFLVLSAIMGFINQCGNNFGEKKESDKHKDSEVSIVLKNTT